MTGSVTGRFVNRLVSDYGMLLALGVLCAFFSYATLSEQDPNGEGAANQVVKRLSDFPAGTAIRVVAVAGSDKESDGFVRRIQSQLGKGSQVTLVAVVQGEPRDIRRAFERVASDGQRVDAILATREVSQWKVLQDLDSKFSTFGNARILTPTGHLWPDFLKKSNLMAIADRIVVIALIAIGMTMVIVTGGIDLSVGSLIALSSVLSTLLIRDLAGAENASSTGMLLSCICGIVACGGVGGFSGVMVTQFGIPPFIVTLAMMMVASGLAFILAEGQSIYQLPDSFVWLGRGADLRGIPNTVVLMVFLYGTAHVLMTRTVTGRHIYAVGGNREASVLSGVPVKRVLVFVYTVCGLLAGLGGVIQASQLKSGAPTYGLMYELYVIAAVVVGGTSLAGGQGTVLGTLIGAFIIAVIQNGMNLTGVESYTQKVALGLILLAAVLVDRLKGRRG